MNILEIKNLSVTIGNFHLLIENLSIKKGEIYQIKGENGSGKTVLLNTILGFINYAGEMKIYTNDIHGFINNETLVPYLSPMEYIHFIGKINRNANYILECKKLAEKLQFDLETKTYIRNLSEGNKKKIGVISILGLESDLMIFDEPFAFLDTDSCKALSEIFIQKREEKTLVFTSHQELDNLKIDQSYHL